MDKDDDYLSSKSKSASSDEEGNTIRDRSSRDRDREKDKDTALLRPGRFDRHVFVQVPDIQGREQILNIHAKKVKLADSVSLRNIAKDTAGMVGADLANVINEAALLATRRKRDSITQDDLSEAVDKVSMGPARRSVKRRYRQSPTFHYRRGSVRWLSNGRYPSSNRTRRGAI